MSHFFLFFFFFSLHGKSASLEVEVASHVHKVRLILELHDGLEDQSPAAHPEQTAGVFAVGEHPACGGNTRKCQRREAGMNFSSKFYRLQTYSSVRQGVCVCVAERQSRSDFWGWLCLWAGNVKKWCYLVDCSGGGGAAQWWDKDYDNLKTKKKLNKVQHTQRNEGKSRKKTWP